MQKIKYGVLMIGILMGQLIFWASTGDLATHLGGPGMLPWWCCLALMVASAGLVLWLWTIVYWHPLTTNEQCHAIACPLATNPYLDHQLKDCV